MKLITKIGGLEISFETSAELKAKLVAELGKADKRLAEYAALKKQRNQIAKAITQLEKPEKVKPEEVTAQ